MPNDTLKWQNNQVATLIPRYERGTGNRNNADSQAKKDAKEDKSTANALIELAARHCAFFHDERGDGYAVVTDNQVQLTLGLRSKAFRRWLAGTFYKTTERAANNEALSTALSVLEAKATYDNPQLELSNRFAMRDGEIYIDLTDKRWRAIKVTVAGGEIVDKPPAMFRRYSHQQALPDPGDGGRLSDIHRHLRIKSKEDQYLVEAWLVACAFSNVPRPAITFHGPQGASKTTTARCIKAITDPSLTGSVDLGKSPADLAQILDHHGVPCFDNLTSIPTWAADMLCRGVTGGAFAKRELYSDNSDVILSFKRPIIITGINIPTHAPDLLDRLLLIELERIPANKRMDETTFWTRFNADLPLLFGALLDAMAGTLRHLPTIKLSRMARMADFTRIACAYAEYAGIGSKRMLSIIMKHASRQTEEVLQSDPVATAILNFIKKQVRWTGTATELLNLLNEAAYGPRPEKWPRQANNLTRQMNVLQATLEEAGISVTRQKKGRKGDKQVTLEYKAKSSSASSAPSNPPIDGSLPADGNLNGPSVASSREDGKCEVKQLSSALSSAIEPSIGAASGDAGGKDDKSEVISRTLAGYVAD
ncbi:hypothetical protein [Nitrosospira briensis]|uniref:hypothetical protein n=1 Tax=Nitrosospira briensis TaxID=35799 RepID=UPI0008EF4B51|nr:hypothetical protein [Nitrosospira briensis]SFO12241.1 hypothetical protein SAMN05216332_105156 [Nitrosospira briensis]